MRAPDNVLRRCLAYSQREVTVIIETKDISCKTDSVSVSADTVIE